MTAGAFGLTMVATVLALGVIPGWVARSRRALFVSDIALILVPALLFYTSGYFFNKELHIGWGLIIYPFFALVASVTLLYARVFLFDRLHPNPSRNSVICLMSACVAAIVVGVIIPPLYE